MAKNMEYDEDSLFRDLVLSGFEFLERAIKGLEESPKFSTIHFAVSIELFLKARLLREHWSLVFDKPENADKKKFYNGELKTVTQNIAFQRLKCVACDPVPEDAIKSFRSIAKHRNRMIHFVHGAFKGGDGAGDELNIVASEQLRGWYYLQGLLTYNWSDHFSDFRFEINQVTTKMAGHKRYLKIKYASLSDEISDRKNNEGISKCPSCYFDSLAYKKLSSAIFSTVCLVCKYNGTSLSLKCQSEDCAEVIEFDSYAGAPTDCPKCESPFSDSISGLLDTGVPVTKDNYFEHVDVNCPFCFSLSTVVDHNDIYVCTSCFAYSEKMSICDFCSGGQLGGVSETSYHTGCEFCEGSISYGRDGD